MFIVAWFLSKQDRWQASMTYKKIFFLSCQSFQKYFSYHRFQQIVSILFQRCVRCVHIVPPAQLQHCQWRICSLSLGILMDLLSLYAGKMSTEPTQAGVGGGVSLTIVPGPAEHLEYKKKDLDVLRNFKCRC